MWLSDSGQIRTERDCCVFMNVNNHILWKSCSWKDLMDNGNHGSYSAPLKMLEALHMGCPIPHPQVNYLAARLVENSQCKNTQCPMYMSGILHSHVQQEGCLGSLSRRKLLFPETMNPWIALGDNDNLGFVWLYSLSINFLAYQLLTHFDPLN